MAKQLKAAAITSAELIEFLDTSSNFAFELRCLERLSELGFQCQHGGSYTDRVTNKARQFDIRAQRENDGLRILCAVECKHLSRSYPLLIMCVPRTADESFHEVVFSYHPDMMDKRQRTPFDLPKFYRKNCHAIRHPASDYGIGHPVGKSSAQVGKAQQDNTTVASDAEVSRNGPRPWPRHTIWLTRLRQPAKGRTNSSFRWSCRSCWSRMKHFGGSITVRTAHEVVTPRR